jgi:CBS domain-containing protein
MSSRKPTPRKKEATVDSLMQRNFTSVTSAASLVQADGLMRLARMRHLPVVDSGRLVGVLSHRDVLEASDPTRALTVDEVMHAEPCTVQVKMTLGDAARRMLRFRVGCLPVVQSGHGGNEMIGLLTERDLLRAAYAPDADDGSD